MNEANQTPEQPFANDDATTPVPPEPKSRTTNRAPLLSIIAILLTAGLGSYVYYHGHQQATLQQKNIAALQAEIANLKQTTKQTIIEDLQSNITDAVNQQNQQFSSLEQRVDKQLTEQQKNQEQLNSQVNDSTKLNQQGLAHLNERLSAMSTTDNSVWLISQANYLVHLAGRKIWNDQDYTTARLLLKSADESLAQANDPSLLPARQAISKDIASLGEISFVDADGIILNLLSLADSVTNLPLISNAKEANPAKVKPTQTEMPAPSNAAETSSGTETNTTTDANPATTTKSDNESLFTHWKENLWHSAQSFTEKFIHIEKIDQADGFDHCLAQAAQDEQKILKCQILKTPITLEQSMYLRENIRFQLLIAAQAVPRHHEQIYQRSLHDAATWANAYFDGNAPSVKAFMSDIEKLQQQSITNQSVPDKLASSSELEKLMQTRVRSMLAK